jgi:hypothetical protein
VGLPSSDGITWAVLGDGGSTWQSITYGNNIFVGLDEWASIYSSPDLLHWSRMYSKMEDNETFHSSVFANGYFVAVGRSIVTSPNGKDWTVNLNYTKNPSRLNSIAFGNNRFLAVGSDGATIASNADSVGIFNIKIKKTEKNKLTLYLTKNRIIIKISQRSGLSQLKIDIISISGKRVYSAFHSANNGSIVIPSKNFPAGTYLATIKESKNVTVSLPIIITR